ncbi:hypothetical protein HGM15179_010549, partial [Zosterops borbonicus]
MELSRQRVPEELCLQQGRAVELSWQRVPEELSRPQGRAVELSRQRVPEELCLQQGRAVELSRRWVPMELSRRPVPVGLCREPGGAGQVAAQAAQAAQAAEAAGRARGRAGGQHRPGPALGLGAPSFQGRLRLLGRAAGKGKRDRAWSLSEEIGKRQNQRAIQPPCRDTNSSCTAASDLHPATFGSLDLDLEATVDISIKDNCTVPIPTGVKGPVTYQGQPVPALLLGRSSTFLKGLDITVGFIDADFT